jgi:rhodanese-related sulfurtransferase
MKHGLFWLAFALIIAVSFILSGCDYITGEAPEAPSIITTLPRWVWSASDGPYSIIVDRLTHEPIREVTVTDAFGIIGTSSHSENPVVIDVRTPEEYTDGYIRGAVNIDFLSSSFRDEVAKLDRDKQYIVYCRTGSRSSAARNVMEELGFKHVIKMTGGFTDWVAAGLPIEEPQASSRLSFTL